MAFAAASSPPDWLDAAQRAQRLADLRAEQVRISEQLDALAGCGQRG